MRNQQEQEEFLKSLKKGDRITLEYSANENIGKILENYEGRLVIYVCYCKTSFYYDAHNLKNSRLAPLRILGFTFGTGRAKRH